jgi:hypothetical protein
MGAIGAEGPAPAGASVPAACRVHAWSGDTSARSTPISRERSTSSAAACTDADHTIRAVGPLRSTAQVGQVVEALSGVAQDGQRVASVRMRSSIME